MTYSDGEHIDYIIDRFDFDAVHNYMENVDWRWVGSVPTISKLKSESLELLMRVTDREVGDFISMGGLIATKCSDHLKLDFSIVDVESIYLNLSDNYEKDKKQKERNYKLKVLNDIQRLS